MNSKKTILFVQLPPWGTSTFPLGISYLHSYLAENGINVKSYDLNIELFNSAPADIKDKWSTGAFEFWAGGSILNNLWFDFDDIAERIIEYKTDFVGFSATFASIPFFNSLVRIVKKKRVNLNVVVGGGGTTYKMHRDLFDKSCIDYFIVGEGEEPLLFMLKGEVSGNSRFSVYDEDNTRLVKSVVLPDVNTIPAPYFGDFDETLYTEHDLMPSLFSRGCFNRCNFCCDWRVKRPYRGRQAYLVAEEIKNGIERYGRNRIEFCDLLINGNLKELEHFCDIVIGEKLGIVWGAQAAVRKDMSLKLFKKMRDAGCGSLTFGFESFSDPLLKKMNKPFKAKDAERMIKLVKKAGMRVEANLIVGFPGEDEKDIRRTKKFLKKNRKFIDNINSLNICSIGPGMTIWEDALRFGIDKSKITDWYAWFSMDGKNNIGVRERRHRELKNYINSLGWNLSWENVKNE